MMASHGSVTTTMSLKVKAYSLMPAFLKEAITRAYIARRKRREKAAAAKLTPPASDDPKVVYLTGFPRSATTMLKYYFSNYPGLVQGAFTPIGFFDAWSQAESVDGLLVDKSNHYIYSLEPLFAGCGHGARVAVIVRDPRDCLVSFIKYQENREVPRDERFWAYWSKQHAEMLRFARESEFGKRMFLLRYEDLVRFPEEAKAAFLNWLGFGADAADLDRKYRNEHPGEGWHDSVHDYREVGTHALQKWKQVGELPEWAERALPRWKEDEEASEMMRLFGYTEDGFCDLAIEDGSIAAFRPSGEKNSANEI